MSFYRSLVATVAALGLSTVVLADTAATATTATQPAMQTQTQTADATQDKINLNKATVKELMNVKGLSSRKAKAIVAYRTKHGAFNTLEQLKDVKGFKKMNTDAMQKIQDQLTLG